MGIRRRRMGDEEMGAQRMSAFIEIREDTTDELGAVAEFASNDAHRVALTRVWLQLRHYEFGYQLRAWATDSHILGVRTVWVPDHGVEIDSPLRERVWVSLGGYDAKEWKAQLKAVIKSSKMGRIGIEYDGLGHLEVGRQGGIATKLRQAGEHVKPPKFEQLIDGFQPMSYEPNGPVQVALNPEYLVRITKGIAMTPSKRATYPLRIYVPQGSKPRGSDDEYERLERHNLTAWAMECVHNVSNKGSNDPEFVSRLQAMIMPVRLRDGWLASSFTQHGRKAEEMSKDMAASAA